MNSVDPRVRELFIHIHRAFDIIEELMLRPPVAPAQQSRPEVRQPPPFPSPPSTPQARQPNNDLDREGLG
jgi:hypothetical protein